MFKKTCPSNNQKGYTIIELLVVVAVIGLLAGVFLTVVNSRSHVNNSTDGVRRAILLKLVEGMEAYRVAEGSYPIDTGGNGSPLEEGGDALAIYIQKWPNDEPPGTVYTYVGSSSGAGSFGIVVSVQGGNVLKYRSTWSRVQRCGSTTAANDSCPTPTN